MHKKSYALFSSLHIYIASENCYISVNVLKVHQIKTVVSIDDICIDFLTNAIFVSVRFFFISF